MLDEREKVKEANDKLLKEYSGLYALWQMKQMEIIRTIIEPVKTESWFEKWFEFGDRFIICNANNLAKGCEYIYEPCEELK